jgi:hypothetical protein
VEVGLELEVLVVRVVPTEVVLVVLMVVAVLMEVELVLRVVLGGVDEP